MTVSIERLEINLEQRELETALTQAIRHEALLGTDIEQARADLVRAERWYDEIARGLNLAIKDRKAAVTALTDFYATDNVTAGK